MRQPLFHATQFASVLIVIAAMGAATAAQAADLYTGSSSCKPCHADQFSSWSSSLHADAMREAGDSTASAFKTTRATFGKQAKSSIEFRGGARARTALIREESADAKSYDIRYLLGRRPMEQYLVETTSGRLQALPVAYDPAKKQWFDIFSGEERLPGDFGHWTGRGMNANSQCIECHTTGYSPGYDAKTEAYSSTWSEMGVGCESCHGAGAAHVANPKLPYGPFGRNAGIALFRPGPTPNESVQLANATPPPAASVMLDVCATCHSVRRRIADGFTPGGSLLDHYEPALLDEDLYWPDGSVRLEAYEWASFLKSRMHEKGVNCLACHEVHSGELRAKGNALCLTCHPAALAAKAHTLHKENSPGSECVSCHMPESVFMARDRRRDHSLSVPDPISARETGSPSACESCHADRGRDTLAADAERLWPALKNERHARRRVVAKALAGGRAGNDESAPALRDCVTGATCASPILRASAARLSARVALDAQMAGTLLEALEDSEPLVRSAAAYALADVDPREPMLRQYLSVAATDKVRSVRLNAAWALRTIETERLPRDQSEPLQTAFTQWRESTMLLSDAPESWHSLGVFETARRDPKAAETAYRKAIAMELRAVPSRHNLAMLLIAQGRIDDAKTELDALVAADDGFAPAWYALGMIHGEQKRWPEAAKTLGKCLKLDPNYPGALTDLTHAYLKAGVANVARAVLSGALQYPPARREALAGLVTVALETGEREQAATAARALVAEDPSAKNDPEIARLLAEPDPAAPAAQTPAGGAAAPPAAAAM